MWPRVIPWEPQEAGAICPPTPMGHWFSDNCSALPACPAHAHTLVARDSPQAKGAGVPGHMGGPPLAFATQTPLRSHANSFIKDRFPGSTS